LIERRHEVIIIEKDRDEIINLSDTWDCRLNGDGSKFEILREVDPEQTDALICLTDSDHETKEENRGTVPRYPLHFVLTDFLPQKLQRPSSGGGCSVREGSFAPLARVRGLIMCTILYIMVSFSTHLPVMQLEHRGRYHPEAPTMCF